MEADFFWSHSKSSNSSTPRARKQASMVRDVFIILGHYGSTQGAEATEASSVLYPPQTPLDQFTCLALCQPGRLVHL